MSERPAGAGAAADGGGLDRLPGLIDADPALVRRGRFLSATFLVEVGDAAWLVTVHEGRVTRVERGPFLLRAWRFAIRAPAEAWARFWEPVPPPGYHDLFAMAKLGPARIEGDLQPLLANLFYVKGLLRTLRRPGPPAVIPAPGEPPGLEPILGRYLRLPLEGRAHRIYFEEAGAGIPLLCLHTAGADSRQFRHLLTDRAVTDHFRVLAFDLPRHGKSLPPAGWEHEEYRLTTDAYVATVLGFAEALGLFAPGAGRPVVLGCSIGGKIVLELARRHPERFRALVGLEAADYQAPWYDDTSWLHRADVHGGEVCGALMSGLIAPQAPAESRWETLWMYMQGGPGVFRGDLHFYRADDFRERVGEIDTRRCPLYLLTGEYDYSCTPEDTRRTAARIPGARVTVMRELGHFPMSEHPARFREYLLPVLEQIRAAAPGS